MTGMEHAIEQAASVIDKAMDSAEWRWAEDPDDAPTFLARALADAGFLAPAQLAETIVVPRPHVPHGPKHLPANAADVHYLRDAAHQLEEHYKPFGSNLRATVVKLLRDAADAVNRAEGDGRGKP